ncbi:hypothetical protein GGR55DRAFT_650414 [Xylaria sp. FL0064]|nr:hypothetical protein GGR55DRAFT_650414 [Xylaria sp. FL0064]
MAPSPRPAHSSVGVPHTTVTEAASHAQASNIYGADIPNKLNASVWVKNLPPDVDHATLLNSIRDCGKVFATYINPPQAGYTTVASTIVFFDVAGARNLLRQSREGRFIVNGYLPVVNHNGLKVAAQPPSSASRVLLFEGPSCIVNPANLSALFLNYGILWEDEAIIVLSQDAMFTRLEWRFASYHRQAQAVWDHMDRMFRDPRIMHHELWRRVAVRYGADPCDLSLPSRR